MWSNVVRRTKTAAARSVSLDVVALVGVVAGCATVLLQAQDEGTEPLRRQVRCSSSSQQSAVTSDNKDDIVRDRLVLSNTQWQQLSLQGYVVVDDFLSPTEVQEALASARYIEAQSSSNENDENQLVFAPSQNQRNEVTRGEKRVRSDRVCFLGGGSSNSSNVRQEHKENNKADASKQQQQQQHDEQLAEETRQLAGLKHVRSLLRGVSCTVNESEVFTGFSSSSSSSAIKQADGSSWMGVDHVMQVSLYDKEEENGTNNNNTGSGAYYRPYRDGCSDTWTDLGLLGYLRSTYLRKRYLTAVVYINDTDTTNDDSSWNKKRDGGCLRLFLPNHDNDTESTEEDIDTTVPPPSYSFMDVEPVGGRLVLFSSQHLWHAVCPTLRQRFACTLWTYLNE